MRTMKINYDNRFDTLYVVLSDNSNSYGDDTLNDIILMRNMDTDEITGVTILSFLKKYHSGALSKLPLDLGFSIETDILPNIN